MNIIRLTKGQKNCSKVEHPLLDMSQPMTEEDLAEAKDRDSIILGHLYFVKIIVGRFLANWPETRRFEEDMVSEGVLALTKYADDTWKSGSVPSDFQPTCWTKIRVAIEDMLNRDRSTSAPSRREQWREIEEGREPIYHYARTFNEKLEAGESSYDPEFIDILDELDFLSETDREALYTVIIKCMEQDHGILESEITDDEKQAIDDVTRAITGM
jgi:hypothetical protein